MRASTYNGIPVHWLDPGEIGGRCSRLTRSRARLLLITPDPIHGLCPQGEETRSGVRGWRFASPTTPWNTMLWQVVFADAFDTFFAAPPDEFLAALERAAGTRGDAFQSIPLH